jgi:hypothetical protein
LSPHILTQTSLTGIIPSCHVSLFNLMVMQSKMFFRLMSSYLWCSSSKWKTNAFRSSI